MDNYFNLNQEFVKEDAYFLFMDDFTDQASSSSLSSSPTSLPSSPNFINDFNFNFNFTNESCIQEENPSFEDSLLYLPSEPLLVVKTEPTLSPPQPTHSSYIEGVGKKRAISEVYEDTPCAVNIEKESDIKKLNLAEIDKAINEKKYNSLEEEKKLKKERRLIKNRESAQQSRQRKKQFVENLQHQVKKLTEENAKLKNEYNTIRNDYYNLLNYVKSANISLQNTIQPITNIKKHIQTAGLTTLFILLLTFGIYFQSPSPSSPLDDFSSGNINTYYHGLTLKQLESSSQSLLNLPQFDLSQVKQSQQSSSSSSSSSSSNSAPQPFELSESTPVYTATPNAISSVFSTVADIQIQHKYAQLSKIAVIDDEIDMENSNLNPNSNPNSVSLLHKEIEVIPDLIDDDVVIPNSLDTMKNNSYIYCPSAFQLENANQIDDNAENDVNDFPLASFVVPATSFPNVNLPPETFVEVTCKILQVNVFNYSADDLPSSPQSADFHVVTPMVI